MRVNANAVLRSWTLLAAFGGSYAPDNMYVCIYVCLYVCMYLSGVCIRQPALRANAAGQHRVSLAEPVIISLQSDLLGVVRLASLLLLV